MGGTECIVLPKCDVIIWALSHWEGTLLNGSGTVLGTAGWRDINSAPWGGPPAQILGSSPASALAQTPSLHHSRLASDGFPDSILQTGQALEKLPPSSEPRTLSAQRPPGNSGTLHTEERWVKFAGIGPVDETGMPIASRSSVNKPRDWYRSMFKQIHKKPEEFDFDDSGPRSLDALFHVGAFCTAPGEPCTSRRLSPLETVDRRSSDGDPFARTLYGSLPDWSELGPGNTQTVQGKQPPEPKSIFDYEPGKTSTLGSENQSSNPAFLTSVPQREESLKHLLKEPRLLPIEITLAKELRQFEAELDSEIQGLERRLSQKRERRGQGEVLSPLCLLCQRKRTLHAAAGSHANQTTTQRDTARRLASHRRAGNNQSPVKVQPASNTQDSSPAIVPEVMDLPPKREEKKMRAARAKFNFQAQSPKELTLQKGDVVYIHRQVDANWFEGEHHGRAGIFPTSYVELIPPTEKPTPIKSPAVQVLEYGEAVALFTFPADLPVELSFRKVRAPCVCLWLTLLLHTGPSSNHWGGSHPTGHTPLNRQAGAPLSPSSPILVSSQWAGTTSSNIPKQDGLPSNSIQGSAKSSAIPQIPPHPGPLQLQRQPYKAVYNYKPQNRDELELWEGDIVQVMEKCDDGWFVDWEAGSAPLIPAARSALPQEQLLCSGRVLQSRLSEEVGSYKHSSAVRCGDLLQRQRAQACLEMSLTVNLIGPSPWGFRISGGRDFKKAIAVSKVNGGSKAESAGLRPGDVIAEINGESTAEMLNVEAQNKIKSSKTKLQLVVDRSEPLSPGQTNGLSSPEHLAVRFQEALQPSRDENYNDYSFSGPPSLSPTPYSPERKRDAHTAYSTKSYTGSALGIWRSLSFQSREFNLLYTRDSYLSPCHTEDLSWFWKTPNSPAMMELIAYFHRLPQYFVHCSMDNASPVFTNVEHSCWTSKVLLYVRSYSLSRTPTPPGRYSPQSPREREPPLSPRRRVHPGWDTSLSQGRQRQRPTAGPVFPEASQPTSMSLVIHENEIHMSRGRTRKVHVDSTTGSDLRAPAPSHISSSAFLFLDLSAPRGWGGEQLRQAGLPAFLQTRPSPPSSVPGKQPDSGGRVEETPFPLLSSDAAMQRFDRDSEVYKMIQENKESRSAPRQSSTFRLLQEVLEADEKEAALRFPGKLSPNAPKPSSSVAGVQKFHTCEKCGTSIVTQAVRIMEDRYRHPECYTCTQCCLNLKMRGHFWVGDEMFCEKHAKERYQGPGSTHVTMVSPHH
ncbi:VINEX protein, partial [Atractosteus spatula]|nr:VINEX protein [Atractosteus spatula]